MNGREHYEEAERLLTRAHDLMDQAEDDEHRNEVDT